MIKRELNLLKVLGKKTSAFLFGARGVGKTHLAGEFLASIKSPIRVDLLNAADFTRFLTDPGLLELEVEAALKKTTPLIVFIDEVQKLPALLDVVHRLIELHKGNLRFLLSGSSARKLKRGGANLLAGRALTLKLHPLTSREVDFDLRQVLQIGSLPGILLGNEQPELSLKSYVATYLKEEILQEAIVRRIDNFARFLEFAGQYHAEEINASKLAKAVNLSPATVLGYFQILEDTLLGFRLPGWNSSTKKQLRTTPKFYLFDNGVANALRGELRTELRESSSRFGKLFEALIVQEAFRLNDYKDLDLKFSYWKTNSGQEVDLIVSRGLQQPLAAIEIKSGTAPDSADCKGLAVFAEEYPRVPRYCFSRTPRAYTIGDRVEVLPWKDGLALVASL